MIPFVGAGVSVLTGCPTWNELADGALRACVDAQKFTHSQLAQIKHLSPRVKLSIARELEKEHGLRIDYAKLINPKSGYENNEVGRRVYRSLGKLGQTFVTTNYDSWLDTEIVDPNLSVSAPGQEQDTAAATPSRRKSIWEANEFTPANLNQSKSVFHIHGSLSDPTGMVISTRDYIARYANDRNASDPQHENRTLTFLSHLFQTKTVLFVGYGLEDLEILEYVVQKARVPALSVETQARHFMLQGYFSHENELMRSMSQYYKQCGIQLIPFLRDYTDWAQLVEVLERFSDAIPAAAPLNLQMQMEMESLLD
ncbi:SIR2 family protein [Bradyrhizobium sp. AZCC 1578]|uniref:SIR2 family protein n=1 Tax=Bradyrhizobium sp. AZCC 1578 TaxID=3117027 RepID=UPI002FF3FFC6